MTEIIGTELSDTTLIGGINDDTITGLGGNDVIITGGGLDHVNGGAGKDQLVVDYSQSTSIVTMVAPTATGVAFSGSTAPGASTIVGTFDADVANYTVNYSGIDLTQENHLWLAVGGSNDLMSLQSIDNGVATFAGAYHFSLGPVSVNIGYSLVALASQGDWVLPTAIGLDSGGVGIHEIDSADFSINYAITIQTADGFSQSLIPLVQAQIEGLAAEFLNGKFYYDDGGSSGEINSGLANSVHFDDIESFNITTGSAGSNITTAAGDDKLTGGVGADIFHAGGGDDLLKGGKGNDILDGGRGSDTVDYSDQSKGLTVVLKGASEVMITLGMGDHDTLANIENLNGGKGGDKFTGDGSVNQLFGNGGNDRLIGGGGGDVLTGGRGHDILTGGTGNDVFLFQLATESAGASRDEITDFSKRDKIDLSAIDAIEASTADNKFHLLAKEDADLKHAGDLHYVFKGQGVHATTVVEGDTDGNARPDFSIVLDGHVHLANSSFDL